MFYRLSINVSLGYTKYTVSSQSSNLNTCFKHLPSKTLHSIINRKDMDSLAIFYIWACLETRIWKKIEFIISNECALFYIIFVHLHPWVISRHASMYMLHPWVVSRHASINILYSYAKMSNH